MHLSPLTPGSTLAAVPSKAAAKLSLIYCLWGFCVGVH